MSAGVRNSLGHQAETPESKLAGMKLGHFAGFLKRSWRANDWLWGRLDGAEYAVRCVLDLDYLADLPDLGPVASQLSEFAFPADDQVILFDCWARTLKATRTRRYAAPHIAQDVNEALDQLAASDPPAAFVALLENGFATRTRGCLRNAVGLLPRGARRPNSAENSRGRGLREVARGDRARPKERGKPRLQWRRVGAARYGQHLAGSRRQISESPGSAARRNRYRKPPPSSAWMLRARPSPWRPPAFSGSKGGLPAAVRAPLGAVRGLTLVFNIIVRLLVRTPVFGIAAVLAATVALVWALTEPTALLSAAIPGLAALVIGGATVLIAMATSPLEAPSRSGWQRAGLLIIIAAPLVILALILAFPFGWEADVLWLHGSPLATGEPASWLSQHTTDTSTDIARWLVVAAAVAAVLRLVLGRSGRRFRIVDLWVYRWVLLLAAGAVAGGVVYEHVRSSDRSWNGTILVLILFGAISLAPLVAELSSGGRWAVKQAFRAESWRTGERYLEVGVWILLFALLLPAFIAGCAVGKGSDESAPATTTVTITTAP